jgi:c-di-GMP-binding flagellar brake protein YcgR
MVDGYGVSNSDGDCNGDGVEDLEFNDHVLIESEAAGRLLAFRSVIVKVCPTELWLGLASPDRRLESLGRGQTVRLTVARQGAALLGQSVFLRALGESRSRVFAVVRPEVFGRVQRRAHVRYEIDLPVQFRHLDPATWTPRGKGASGTTVNLSPGGLLLRTDASVAVGEELELTLPLSGGDRISTTDRVIRVLRPPEPAPGGTAEPQRAEVAVQFTRITAIDRDWIVRFVLATEHRRREAALRHMPVSLPIDAPGRN